MSQQNRRNQNSEGGRVSKGDDYSRAITRELFAGASNAKSRFEDDGDDDNMLSISDFIQPSQKQNSFR